VVSEEAIAEDPERWPAWRITQLPQVYLPLIFV
jgi:hypothetical protein